MDTTENFSELPCSSKKAASTNADINNKQDLKQFEDLELENIVSAEEYLMREHVDLLDYEKQMFLDLVHTDALTVCAKGLHYDRVLINIFKVFCDSGNLVLVVNSSEWEEEYYKGKLNKKYVHEVANTASERELNYLEGGIQFIRTRILVVDLLKQRIPIELLTGIIVLRAHSIIESCQEAFALSLFRQNNKTGFIKGFSNSAEAFTFGYSNIERTMRNLYVKELFIWPRFHASVQAALKPFELQTIELQVPMPNKMSQIQIHILDIMNYLVREIKRINRLVDMEEITVENCVTKKFYKILQAQLDCIWHQLSSQTKLIVADLKILRGLMISTMYQDSVSAYALMNRYRRKEYAINNSGWTLLDSAEQMFKLSRERVYNPQNEFDPEPCPKWKFLNEILSVEIPGDMKRTHAIGNIVQPKVLLLCQDASTCYQLKQFLTGSSERFLLFMATKHQIPLGKLGSNYERILNAREMDMCSDREKRDENKQGRTNKNKQEIKSDAAVDNDDLQQIDELTQILNADDCGDVDANFFQESYMLKMTQPSNKDLSSLSENDVDLSKDDDSSKAGNALNASIFEPFPEFDNLDLTAAIADCKQPIICIQTFKTEREGSMALDRILDEIKPHYVIMYHCNVAAIRQIEIQEARQQRIAKQRMKIFFLIHARTVEEQTYLTSLRREKQAFEMIIEKKTKMVIPEYQDGKTDEAFVLCSDPELDNINTRKAGGQGKDEHTSKVIVDMREFRSDLPCLLHKRGVNVVPITISIGDYILTPEICVERKSISDLIGSLNSGRLYNQCIQMQRYYAKPILLIEFDQNKPFHLQGKFMLSQHTTSANADIMQKLQLLTLHFSKLRLIWSPSPYATVQLFEDLKLGKDEPDSQRASDVGSSENVSTKEFNTNIYDFLMRLPGVNAKNIHKLMRHGFTLKELLKKTQQELNDLVESEQNAKLLWDVLHVSHLPEKDEIQGSIEMLAAAKQLGSYSRLRRGAALARATRGSSLRSLKK